MISIEEHKEKTDELFFNLMLMLNLSLECRQLYSDLINDDGKYIYPKSENLLIELKNITLELLTELIG